jgi:integrase
MKTALTDRAIKAMRAAGKAYDVHDAVVPGLSLSVLPSGLKRFVLLTRFPGAKHPTRRALGAYGALTLEAARKKARIWLELIARGIDPSAEAEREKRAQERKQRTTFAAVVDDYLAHEIVGLNPAAPRKRSAGKMRNALVDVLVPLFGARPIADLTAADILPPLELIARIGSDRALVKLGARKRLRRPGRKAQASPEQARALFVFCKMIFNWALDHGGYGLERNPLERVSKARRLGTPVRRDRTLSDEELAALVLAIERLPVPHRQAYQALLHSGLRLNEAAAARWSEIDGEVWTIAADRMKGRNSGAGQARPHAVPLTPALRKIFAAVPRGERGDFIFSSKDGARPIATGSNRLKRMLDAEMLAILCQRAAARGEDVDKVTLPPWRNHDIRRSCRSTLSRLGVTEDVAEAVLAHQRGGVVGIYDRWHRLPEKRDALERWSRFLAELVRPAAGQDGTRQGGYDRLTCLPR